MCTYFSGNQTAIRQRLKDNQCKILKLYIDEKIELKNFNFSEEQDI